MSEQTSAEKLFTQVLDWFQLNYGNYDFFVERDVVWTFQQRLTEMVCENNLPFEVYNDFPMIKAERRSFCTDLAVLNRRNEVELAVELKYEPDHRRGFGVMRDIWPTKLSPSVVFWGEEGVEKDVERARQYVSQRIAKSAISLFIDEGGLFRHRQPPQNTKWTDWNCGGKKPRKVAMLIGYNR